MDTPTARRFGGNVWPQTIAIVAEDKVTGEGELRVLDSQPMSQSKVVSVKTQ
jgi:hypothetical protein